MRSLLFILVLLAGSVFGQESESDQNFLYHSSQAAVVGGVSVNVLMNFQPHTASVLVPCPFGPAYQSGCVGQYAPGYIQASVTTHPLGRTVALSVSTAAALVIEHFIVKKWPGTKRWLAVVNVGGAATAFGTSF